MKYLLLVGIAFGFTLGAGIAEADAKPHRYVGHHPIHDKDGGYCYVEFPHVHVYAPKRAKLLYRTHDDTHHFVGDPVAHGYDGDKHPYHGAHPIHVHHSAVAVAPAYPGVVWCHLKGPHFHAYTPPPEAKFEVKGDVHWYVGTYPEEFEAERKERAPVNRVYARVEYERPVVVVEPPAAYVDVLVVGPGVRTRGHVGVGAAVEVHVPIPSLEVSIGVDGHHHHGKHRKHRKHRKYKKHGKRGKRGKHKGWH